MNGVVAVIGGGSWGTAFAALLARSGNSVRLLVRDPAHAAKIRDEGCNARYLPELELDPRIDVVALGAAGALEGVDAVAVATPSRAAGEIAALVAERCAGRVGVLNLTKGLDPATGDRLSAVWSRALGDRLAFCALTGPNHAEEVARGFPAAAVIGGHPALAERIQQAVNSERFRVYVNDDLIGIELCAAAKNVIALAAGMSDGLGFGDNTKASLMTRGLAEMTRLGVAHGARLETFLGLAGIGDLVATCTSRHSRNRRAGELLARGLDATQIEEELGQVAEGLFTVSSLLRSAERVGVELPITAEVDAVVHHGRNVRDSLRSLMNRSPIAE